MGEIDVCLTPYVMTPLSAVTKPFINQLKSFNEYTENMNKSQLNNNSFLNQNNSMNSKTGPHTKGIGGN